MIEAVEEGAAASVVLDPATGLPETARCARVRFGAAATVAAAPPTAYPPSPGSAGLAGRRPPTRLRRRWRRAQSGPAAARLPEKRLENA